MKEDKMLSVWAWVGIVLLTYGLIIFISGLYYIAHPPLNVVLSYLNPSFWWGIIMLAGGGIMFWIGKRS